jgi:hypothetical protein
MTRAIVKLRTDDLAYSMQQMRTWLDEHRLEAPLFRYEPSTDGLIIQVEFKQAAEAAAFAAAFGGTKDVAWPENVGLRTIAPGIFKAF